jgi:hypothetical protein
MSLEFRNLGHAECDLKICRSVLAESVSGSDDARRGRERIRNAFSQDLTRERNTLQVAINCANQKTTVENNKREKLGIPSLKLPSRRDVQRRLALSSAFDIYAAWFGRQAALTKFRSVAGYRTTKKVLERVEIDRTPLDLFVVDDETGIPLGRPYITQKHLEDACNRLGIRIEYPPRKQGWYKAKIERVLGRSNKEVFTRF